MSGGRVKVIVRMDTEAEQLPRGPCLSVTPSHSSASGKSMSAEKRQLLETAHRNALNSPRPKRQPKAKPLRKRSSPNLPPRPDSPVPRLRIDPSLLVFHPVMKPRRVELKLAASPTELDLPSPTLPALGSPPPLVSPSPSPADVKLPPIKRMRWTLCASRKAATDSP
jgi:hypothetical protein